MGDLHTSSQGRGESPSAARMKWPAGIHIPRHLIKGRRAQVRREEPDLQPKRHGPQLQETLIFRRHLGR